MTIIIVMCAWCGNKIKEIDGKGECGISHGMCKDCYTKIINAE